MFASSIQADPRQSLRPQQAGRRRGPSPLQREADARAVVHRLKNLFGKWCRPNYNSVTATFCHNIAHGLPIQISNPANEVDLTYIDDVVAAFISRVGTARRRSARVPHCRPAAVPSASRSANWLA